MSEIYAGVDLGGTAIKVVLADAAGTIVADQQAATESHEGPQAVLKRIADIVRQLASRASVRPIALGMGVPGLVEVATGLTRFLPNLPTQWRDVPAGPRLAEQLGIPVRLLNDVRTATLGEWTFGHGASASDDGLSTMAFFSLGTGVGGGVVIDGRLRLGSLGAAGELGHQTILATGPRCGCGSRGCLETLASGPAIAAEGIRLMLTGLAPFLHARVDGDADRVTTREMATAADHDPAIREAIVRAAEYLGIGVANVVTILHPDLVVLGGGVAAIGPLLLETVGKTVQQRVGMFPTDGIRIERSKLEDQAGVLGAIALASRGIETI